MNKISLEEIKAIKDANDIVDVIGSYLKLEKKGSNYFAVCPFHDDHSPSMTISKDKQMYTCWVCHITGRDVIDFVSRYEKISWPQAAKKLAKKAGIKLTSDYESPEEQNRNRLYHIMDLANEYFQFILNTHQDGIQAKQYLNNRNITDDIIEQYKLGLSTNLFDSLYQYLLKNNVSTVDMSQLGLITMGENGKNVDMFRNRIMIPIYDHNGNLVAFSGRLYTDQKQSKYINSTDTPIFKKGNVLYNLYNAKEAIGKANKIYICEGFMDVFAAVQAGFPNTVATMGTALTTNNIQRILGLTKNVVLCFDGDDAGIHAMQIGFREFAKVGITPQACVLPDNMDPDEYLRKYGKDKLNDYFTTNSLSVIEWLYRLAKKKVKPNDFDSSNAFKEEVFSSLMLVLGINNTLIEYYLKQLSSDLSIDIQNIKNDFDNYCKTHQTINYNNYNNQPNQEVPSFQPINNNQATSTKKKIYKLTPKIVRAYKFIVYYLLMKPEKISEYVNEIGLGILDNQLKTPIYIILAIKEFYEDMASSSTADISRKITQKIRESSPVYEDYLKDVMNISVVKDNMDIEFKDCLKVILKEKEVKNSYDCYNKAVDSLSNADTEKYLKQRQKEDQKCR